MKKKLLSLCLCGLVTAVTLSASADVKKTFTEKYGNHMGTSNAAEQRDYYLFNAQGNPVRHLQQNANVAGEFGIQNVYFYDYDEQGLLTSYYYRQWNAGYQEWSLRDTVFYEYNDKGQMITEVGTRDTYTYTYDANGNILTKSQSVTQTGMVIQTITYSDFLEGYINKPRKYEASGAYAMYEFDGELIYDERGRLVEDRQLTLVGSKKQTITYTYDDNDVCLRELWAESPSWTPEMITPGSAEDTLRYSKCIERKPLGNNYYTQEEWVYTEMDWENQIYEWVKSNSTYKEVYTHTTADMLPTDVVLTNATTNDLPNAVKISATAPVSPIEGASYIIWRDYEIAAVVTAQDGKIEYVDAGVSSGVHDYMIQLYNATTGEYYGSTDIATIDMVAPLLPASNLRITGGYKGTYKDKETAEYETFYIKLAWNAPNTEYNITGYKIYDKQFAIPVVEVDAYTLTCDVNVIDATTGEFRVDVVYDLGIVEGEFAKFTWDNSQDFTGEILPEVVVPEKDALYLVKQDKNGELIVNLYNAENNLSRVKNLMSVGEGKYAPNYQYYYNYVNGLLDEYYFIQYRDMGVWTDPKDLTYYEYDEQGRLISSENLYTYNDKYIYSYDEQGRLVQYTHYGKKDRNSPSAEYDKLRSTVTYSDFDENNNPQMITVDDALYPTSSYFTYVTYDAKGQVLMEESWKPDLTSDDENAKTPYMKYEYAYNEDGIVVEKIKSNNNYEGGFVYANKETRTEVADNEYEYIIWNYVEYDQEWVQYRTYTENYAPINGKYAPRNLVVTDVTTTELPNAVEITCDVPEQEVDNAQYIIWCDWQPVDTVAAVDGKITYAISSLENDREIEFVVQSYDAVNDVLYNVSDVATINFMVELPPVSNLTYIATTRGEFVNEGNAIPALWVSFKWDAPETNLEILHYNVYMDGWSVPFHTTTNTTDSVYVYRENNFDSPDQQKEVQVEVSVEYMLGESEGVVEIFAVENAGIGHVESVRSAYVAGEYLIVDNHAAVELYNAAGALVANYNNKTRIRLASLPAGVYVARVKVGDTLQVVKIAR